MSLLAQTILNAHLRRAGDQDQLPFIIAAMEEYEETCNRQLIDALKKEAGQFEKAHTITSERLAELEVIDKGDTAERITGNYVQLRETKALCTTYGTVATRLRKILSSYTSTEGDTNKSEL